MIKKIGSLFIAIILMSSVVLAEGIDTLIMPDVMSEVTMTLEELKDYAKTHNKTLMELSKTADDMKDQYEDVKDADREMQIKKEYARGISFETNEEYKLYKGYTMRTTQVAYDVFLKQKELTEETIMYSIENLVYSRKQLMDTQDYMNKMIENIKKEIIIAKIQLRFNMITSAQYEMIELKQKSIDVELLGIENNLKTINRTLKDLVGMDVSTNLEITFDMKFEELSIDSLETIVEDSVKLRLDALKIEQDYINKTVALEYADDRKKTGIDRDEYKDIKKDYTEVQQTYPIDIEIIKDKVRSSYEDLLKSEIAYKNAEASYNLAKVNFEAINKSYQVGMISQIKYETSKLDLQETENKMNKALSDYILAKQMFKINSTVGEISTNM